MICAPAASSFAISSRDFQEQVGIQRIFGYGSPVKIGTDAQCIGCEQEFTAAVQFDEKAPVVPFECPGNGISVTFSVAEHIRLAVDDLQRIQDDPSPP